MYSYRLANDDDMPSVLEMSEKFYKSHMEQLVSIPYDPDSVAMLAFSMMDEGLLVVACDSPEGRPGEGPVIGMLGIQYFQYPFNVHYKMSREVVFWIEPEHRGNRLAAELLAVGGVGSSADDVHSSTLVSLASSSDSVAAMYKVLGYTPLETVYIRKLPEEG